MNEHILLLLSLNPPKSEAELEYLLSRLFKIYTEHGGSLASAKAVAQGIKDEG